MIHDVFREHQDEALLTLLKSNNCLVAFIPPTLTGELQPNDQLVNHILKSKITSAFEDYYTSKFLNALNLDVPLGQITIDTRMVAIRNEHAKWVVTAFNELAFSRNVITRDDHLC